VTRSRIMRWAGHVASLERMRHKWDDNINNDLKEMGCEEV
jgi:hypothetical protein